MQKSSSFSRDWKQIVADTQLFAKDFFPSSVTDLFHSGISSIAAQNIAQEPSNRRRLRLVGAPVVVGKANSHALDIDMS
jgi:hypothetical protein